MKRPEILYVAPCWPHGAPFGSQLRVLHLARALQGIGRVRLAVVDLIGGQDEDRERTAQEFEIACHSRARLAGKLPLNRRLQRVLNSRIANPYGTSLDPSFINRVFGLVDEVDLVWFTNLRPMSSFNRWAWPHSVMDIDDIPSTYERTVAENGQGFGTRLRARWHMLAWQRREKLLSERFSVLGVCSEPDKKYLQASCPVHVIPNGFERPKQTPLRNLSSPPRLGFIGQFDYPPNADGIRWFVRECWPAIKRAHGDVRLRLVGKSSDGPLKPEGPDIDALGWVADASSEIASWSAMVVPVRIGAGTRVKVLEAFSRKCPVVGTRIGVFGHSVRDGEDLLLGDSPGEFANACIRVLREPAAAAAMAERVWNRFLKEWTWDAAATRVQAAAADGLKGNVGELQGRRSDRPLAAA